MILLVRIKGYYDGLRATGHICYPQHTNYVSTAFSGLMRYTAQPSLLILKGSYWHPRTDRSRKLDSLQRVVDAK